MSYGPPPQDPNQQPPQQGGYQQPPQQGGYQQPPQGYQPPPQGYQQPPQAYGQGYQVPSVQNISAGFQGFSLGRKLVLGAGLVSFLMFFMPWYTVSAGIISESGSGLRGLPFLAFLVLIALLVAMALPLFGRRLRDLVPAIPLSEGQIALFGAAGVFVVALLGALIARPDDVGGLVDVGFGWGFYLAMLAMAAMTAGGWLMYQAKE
ncbi:MAG: hypothetical protein H0T53_12970 [Herpetosiphonaceae bacterium]|nr:hypothetical protein [Herpetosiphonaceae bacterium]